MIPSIVQPRSEGSLLPALQSEREREREGQVGENPGNEVVNSYVFRTTLTSMIIRHLLTVYEMFPGFKTFLLGTSQKV